MSMVGRNVLGLQPVGERLLAKISALCDFRLMYFIVYLIISEICILMCRSSSYLLCMACCLSLLCRDMDLVLCMWCAYF
jgi:hypothetical protein